MASFFEDVTFVNTDNIVGGGAAPAGAGQGFTMSGDEMRALLKKVRNLRDSISKQYDSASKLWQAKPPGKEPASENAVNGKNGVNETGRFYGKHLRIQENYYTELILRLEKALGLTEETDRQAADATKKRGTFE